MCSLPCHFSHLTAAARLDSPLKAALYVARYLQSRNFQGIAYHSSASSATSVYLHYPPTCDREAYTDTIPTSPSAEIQGFYDTTLDSQIGAAASDGEEIELFKCCSMSGYLIMQCGGSIAWKAVCQ